MGTTLNKQGIPEVSVVMPVYNAACYVREAIHSIINQSFTDFELLIINDGSTDNTAHILSSFEDDRIRLVQNERNIGIVETLNLGIALACGKYIAIMHADDISMPQRLEQQVNFLNRHETVSLVAAKAVFIDELGNEIGYWQADQDTTTFRQIYTALPRHNCIAHPSVMLRTQVARAFLYKNRHHSTEDYDLWLRLVADKHKIEKIDKVLIKYRVHAASITALTGCDSYKEVSARGKFFLNAFVTGSAHSLFHLKVLQQLLMDACKITNNLIKVRFLKVARFVCIHIGKSCGYIGAGHFPPRHGAIFFFPFSLAHIGGSERVHSEIVTANIHRSPWIILANEWNHNPSQSDSQAEYTITDISIWLRNPFTKNFLIGLFAAYINRNKPVVFGGNCEFFYWLLPYLDRKIFCVDIIHAFDEIMEQLSLPHILRLNRRVVVAEALYAALQSLYQRNGIPKQLCERITFIKYGVEVPEKIPEKSDGQLEVLYVGRNCPVKRIHLVGKIGHRLFEKKLQARVTLIGDVKEAVAEEDQPFCIYPGAVRDRTILAEFYSTSHILLITSQMEGVSLVKLEAMAYGVVPISTAVGGIVEDIIDGETGFLVLSDQDEEKIVARFCTIIENLALNRHSLRQVAVQAHKYAQCMFDRPRMLKSFRDVLEEINDSTAA